MAQQFDADLNPIADNDLQEVSNIITLPVGKRLRLSGASYEVTAETDVPADLAPVVAQKNRHYKVACFNPTCVANQKAQKRRAIAYRGAREVFQQGLPTCGVCGGEYPDGSKHTMEPDGWTLEGPAE
jgi:hypothetical protein